MKRFAICALSVMVLAGVASAQDAQVWIQPVGGGNSMCVGVSDTAVIQVWMEVYSIAYGGRMQNVDTILDAVNQVDAGLHFDVVAFNDVDYTGYAGTWGRTDPRGFFSNPPDPNMDLSLNYQYVGEDLNSPWTASSGLGPGTYLLDEIVIHGTDPTQEPPCPPCDTTTADKVLFGAGAQTPGGFKVYPGYAGYYTATVTMGTGNSGKISQPLFICVTPEPASLSLLVLGGLAAFRRR
jgi:opacity protein-like surface antigen